jgi:broad specificity phosphatase PhoE
MLSAAKWLKSRLRTTDFTPVFASPLHRAIEGARLVAGAATPIVATQEFTEVDFGVFEGLTAAEIRDRYPADFKRWNRDPLDLTYTYPGGESRAAFVARVGHGVQHMLEFLDSAASTTGSTTSLLVAHRGVIRAITSNWPTSYRPSNWVLSRFCGGHRAILDGALKRSTSPSI